MDERERLDRLGSRRSARRAVLLPVRVDVELAARVSAAAKAAKVSRPAWVEAHLRALTQHLLDEDEAAVTA